ncbi:hypothetical protein HPP92_025230 [Vanilla planifolia]|uniref:Uncharacterized protein n=1 Tax=Vanilla planifolia TaxID=51239 RepID=A0A835PI22_VANPL|nr:hypothetical protein HPP92_025230 [Vanilla planifolia]
MVAADAEDTTCDLCGEALAVVYCRPDSARLCLSCDRKVHAANTVSSKHNRSLLCEFCQAAPRRHLLPLVFPTARALLQLRWQPSIAVPLNPSLDAPLLPTSQCTWRRRGERGEVREVEDDWVWDAPPVFSWDDLILPSTTTPFHGFQAMGIPPPPKDRNLYCGKLKEEIHRQIRDLRKAEHDGINYIDEVEPITEFSSMPLESFHREKLYSKHDYNPIFVAPPSSELSNMQSKQRDHQEALSSPINISLVDCTIEAASSANLPGATEKDPNNPNSCGNLTSVPRRDALGVFDRSSVLSRYKEKRKTRRYDKLIRYESRKARADNRVRIKGRFAKVGQI